MRYRIRFNKTKGMPGRGSDEHAWRVFDETGKEFLCKHVRIEAVAISERDGDDWNIVAAGEMLIDRETSVISIVKASE